MELDFCFDVTGSVEGRISCSASAGCTLPSFKDFWCRLCDFRMFGLGAVPLDTIRESTPPALRRISLAIMVCYFKSVTRDDIKEKT